MSAEKGMNVNDTFVLNEAIVVVDGNAFGVETQDGVIQAAKLVATIGKRDLRDQQNREDEKDYGLFFD